MENKTEPTVIFTFSTPEWLERSLGTVNKRIEENGKIEIISNINNHVVLKLTKEDSSYELIPASNALSKMINDKVVILDEIKEYEILELKDGYICISVVNNEDIR